MDKILEMLVQLQAYINNIAPEIWKIYVKQQIISGGINLFFGVICILTAWYFMKQFKLSYKKFEETDNRDEKDASGIAMVISIIIVIICTVIALFIVPEGINKVFNPEYFAIKALITALK